MSGRTLTISLALFLVAVIAVEVETAGPLPGGRTEDGIHMILPDGEANRYWSRWRGPTGQGPGRGNGLPRYLVGHPKRPVAGRGSGSRQFSPIVWGDRIFLTTARDGGKRPSVLCYRRSDGSSSGNPPPGSEPGKVYWKNSHASGTPVTDGQLVYASFGKSGTGGGGFSREGRVAPQPGNDPELSRLGRLAGPLQGQDLPLRGPAPRGVRGRIRQADRQDPLEDRAQGQRRLGHAHRHPGRRPRRADRQQPGAGHGLRSRQRHSPLALWGQPGRGHPTPVVGHGLVFCVSGRAGPTLAIRPGGSEMSPRPTWPGSSPREPPSSPRHCSTTTCCTR